MPGLPDDARTDRVGGLPGCARMNWPSLRRSPGAAGIVASTFATDRRAWRESAVNDSGVYLRGSRP